MVERKTWEEFRSNKLLWFVNMILHLFGWAIVYERSEEDPNKIVEVYPARVKFRGFDESSNTEGYLKLTEYLMNNSKELFDEITED